MTDEPQDERPDDDEVRRTDTSRSYDPAASFERHKIESHADSQDERVLADEGERDLVGEGERLDSSSYVPTNYVPAHIRQSPQSSESRQAPPWPELFTGQPDAADPLNAKSDSTRTHSPLLMVPSTGRVVDSAGEVPGHFLPLGWLTSVIAGPFAIGCSFVVSLVVLMIFMASELTSDEMSDPPTMVRWVQQFALTPVGLVAVVVPGQVTFLLIALLGGALSRDGIKSRLALKIGDFPIVVYPVLALATPFVGFATAIIATLFMNRMGIEQSQHLNELDEMMGSFSGPSFSLLILLVSLLPGICEEFLFRGYIQNRLIKTWPPVIAILFSSIMFAVAHLDPMHIALVFPIGVWLGVICWQTGSIWPAILGHLINNLVSILLSQDSVAGMHADDFYLWCLGGSSLCFVLSVGLLFGLRKSRSMQIPLHES